MTRPVETDADESVESNRLLTRVSKFCNYRYVLCGEIFFSESKTR